MVQYYPEVLFECGCGTVIDSAGKDKTDEYYNLDQGKYVIGKRGDTMKNVKDWIEILKDKSKCEGCGSDKVYPVITPYPYEYISEPFIAVNSDRGIMITCDDCGLMISLKGASVYKAASIISREIKVPAGTVYNRLREAGLDSNDSPDDTVNNNTEEQVELVNSVEQLKRKWIKDVLNADLSINDQLAVIEKVINIAT